MADEIPADHCDIAARRLEEAITRIKSWGVRLNEASRLPAAVRLLRSVARAGRYPSEPLGLIRIGNALTVAVDFRHIASVLPPSFIAPIAEDLKRAAKGTLNDTRSSDALRAQSQLQFGAVLAAASLLPAAPDTALPRQSPDYVITIDGLRCGIEVGRPDGLKGAYAKIRDAIRQVKAFGLRHEVIVLDQSDIITSALINARDGGTMIDVHGHFRAINAEIAHHIATRPDPRIILLVSQMRLFRWSLEPEVMPTPLFKIHLQIFRNAGAGLVQSQSERLRRRLLDGWEALGAVIEGMRPIAS